ncbi:phospholipid/cholesterol/gamma-HCH transport system ATP-binding protein [Palleronia salina]|uniref:Phospholipid/cholesterol/gamma-HCH transport system ATP-binding protein n=2 Tax=Palleronia TaxID=315422 RepID=A0A1M6GM07_9RHOB|nr:MULTISPECIES: ABC transporter ATP-binding protein [Palleronia]SEN13263.1 phospholipid/cholesterol/gamma-HCH transport system ATP-binding protein [Palleronia pelagia]SHJ10935.1 phospholipid/cholesterol/gamma-HCH transport system ATP-binding protein [Palleronia salina]
MADAPVIRVRGLVTRFGRHVVHDGLDLDVRRGEVLGVVGGSGTGKSVLLRAIVGLLRPAEGQIEVLGQSVRDTPPDAYRRLRRRWGVMFQDGALFSSLTVRQNVEAPMREQLDLPPDVMRTLAGIKVRMVGLPEDAQGKYPSELSGGMRKRAGFARAIALDPEIVFLDEPTAGLDPIGAAAFDRLIRQLRDALGLTVFLVTHDLDSLHAVCDRVAVLADRRVLAIGSIADMLDVDHPWVREYFHGPRARAAKIMPPEPA